MAPTNIWQVIYYFIVQKKQRKTQNKKLKIKVSLFKYLLGDGAEARVDTNRRAISSDRQPRHTEHAKKH